MLAKLLSPGPALSPNIRETAEPPRKVGANCTVAVQEPPGLIVDGTVHVVVKLNPGDVVRPNESPLRARGPTPVLVRVIV
jgi:hypothetical protein